MNKLLLLFYSFILSISLVSLEAYAGGEADNNISGQYVMLYYKDLSAPRHFYGNILGLEPTYEDEWVTLYQTTESSYVGVVHEDTGYHKAQDKNAVMLSIVTDDVDAWDRALKAATPKVQYIKEVYNHDKAPIRVLLIQDPAGYTIEIFQWLNK